MTDLPLTLEQEAEAQRLAALIGRKAQEEALRMARLMVSKPDGELLGATEFEAWTGCTPWPPMPSRPPSTGGKKGVPRVEPEPPPRPPGGPLRRVPLQGLRQPGGRRAAVAGLLPLRRLRPGQLPWDATLRLSPLRLTPAAEEVTALAGVQESFGKAADRTPRKLAGLRLCESTVERTTEAAGTRLGEWLRAGRCSAPGDVGVEHRCVGPKLRLRESGRDRHPDARAGWGQGGGSKGLWA